jgi:hypothetical protein
VSEKGPYFQKLILNRKRPESDERVRMGKEAAAVCFQFLSQHSQVFRRDFNLVITEQSLLHVRWIVSTQCAERLYSEFYENFNCPLPNHHATDVSYSPSKGNFPELQSKELSQKL